MTEMKALYNFVPLSDDIALLKDPEQISHDSPFKDCYSGKLKIKLTALSPIFVGGEEKLEQRMVQNQPRQFKHRHFFKLGNYFAIPGSSLKGAMRAVLEPLTFARMSRVDARRPGLRDITSSRSAYSIAIGVSAPQGGWLQRINGEITLQPCLMEKIPHQVLNAKLPAQLSDWRDLFGSDRDDTWKATPVAEKYALWAELGGPTRITHGAFTGELVLTGQISNPHSPRNPKINEFLFANSTHPAKPVDPKDWRGFLEVHDTKDPNSAWVGYWKEKFDAGERVPVFWVDRSAVGLAGRKTIGLAALPKFSADFSVHDCIPSQHRPTDQDEALDFAEALLGFSAEKKSELTLRGRVNFSPLLATNIVDGKALVAILAEPKPAFFPNYLVQKDQNPLGQKRVTGQNRNGFDEYAAYTTYIKANRADPAPKIRGWKRYPARTAVHDQELSPAQKDNADVVCTLHPLEKGSVFEGEISFHNLREFELGALLWLLTWGGNERLRHSVGGAKALGYGQCSIAVSGETFQNGDHKAAQLTKQDKERLVCAFENSFSDLLFAKSVDGWSDSPQIKYLKGMADPDIKSDTLGQLILDPQRPMRNNPTRTVSVNEFKDRKQRGKVLRSWKIDERDTFEAPLMEQTRQHQGAQQNRIHGARSHREEIPQVRHQAAQRPPDPPPIFDSATDPALETLLEEVRRKSGARGIAVLSNLLLAQKVEQLEEPNKTKFARKIVEPYWTDKFRRVLSRQEQRALAIYEAILGPQKLQGDT
jgi:CRISPR-associated protein (TIGR03986 family)